MTASPFPSSTSDRYRSFDLLASLRWRVVASIVVGVGWISFSLLYVAFWAHGFSFFQNVVVIFVSLLILLAGLLGAWVWFGLKFVDRWSD